MHLIIQNLSTLYKNFKRHKTKIHSDMFRIVCDPSSGSIQLYLIEIIRSGSLMFVVCLVGIWQHNFEPVVCVYGTTDWELRISIKYSSILPDDGSHTNRNMSEWFLILCLLKFL